MLFLWAQAEAENWKALHGRRSDKERLYSGLDRASRAKGVTPPVSGAALPLALAAGFGSILPVLGPLLLGGWVLTVERARARLSPSS